MEHREELRETQRDENGEKGQRRGCGDLTAPPGMERDSSLGTAKMGRR